MNAKNVLTVGAFCIGVILIVCGVLAGIDQGHSDVLNAPHSTYCIEETSPTPARRCWVVQELVPGPSR